MKNAQYLDVKDGDEVEVVMQKARLNGARFYLVVDHETAPSLVRECALALMTHRLDALNRRLKQEGVIA